MSTITSASAVIGHDGQPCFGHYATPPTELGLERFVYRTVMDKPASALSKYLHFKQFQFVSLSHPDWQIGIAIADIRYLASAFCYFYDRKTGQLDELELLKPFSLGARMSPSPVKGEARISGKQHISLTLQQYNWQVRLSGALLQGEFSLNGTADASPLALCTPTGYTGRIRLQFTPQQVRQQKLNLGILASNFRQYCGFFCGEITLANSEKLTLQQVPGLAEDHFARW